MNQAVVHPSASEIRRLVTAASLPADDLDALDLDHFLAIGAPDAAAGVVGLEIYGDVALLRSLVVDPARRGHGDGKALVAAAERHAREHGVKRIFLLTTTAAPFFARLGYRDADRQVAPEPIQRTREFSSLCPSSASFMAKTIA